MRTKPMTKLPQALITLFFLCGGAMVSAMEAPGQADIEKMLRQHFTDTQYATRRYELGVESFKCGSPRDGDYWTDGTPANKKTQVIPCKVIWTRVTTYTGSHAEVVKERFTGEYVFFLDEFGDWTFRSKKQESERL